MGDFLSIPGNIRQQYLPFTIAGPGRSQLFTFKGSGAHGDYQPQKQIFPFSSYLKTLIQNDSGIKYTHKEGGGRLDYKEFLNSIPALQIREFVPDARLTQVFKWFSYLKAGFDAGLKNIDSKNYDFSSIRTEIETVMDSVAEKLQDLTSGSAPLLAKIAAPFLDYYQDYGYNVGNDDGFAVLYIPFVLYYRLTTTTTNNVYEIPYSMENPVMKSDGTYGWTSSQSDFGIIDSVKDAISDSPLTKMVLGNTVKVNMMPSFQPTGETHGETITIHLTLVNDSLEAAVANFLMCHTLFGNNRWLQYGFVQTGASLYDVKLPGANRYFMCAGQFTCEGKGAFRTPSKEVRKAILDCATGKPTTDGSGRRTMRDVLSVRTDLLNNLKTSVKMRYMEGGYGSAADRERFEVNWENDHASTGNFFKEDYVNSTLQKRANELAEEKADAASKPAAVTDDVIKEFIKIPDVYSLTLTFNSLLPDNFNNYLFGFRGANLNQIELLKTDNGTMKGAFEDLANKLKEVMGG